jgi:hypothetical protein
VKPRFSPGRIMATPGVLRAFEASGDLPLPYLQRHLSGDWGDLDVHDLLGKRGLKHGVPSTPYHPSACAGPSEGIRAEG